MSASVDLIKGITGTTLADEALQPFLDAAEAIAGNFAECLEELPTNTVDTGTAYLAAHLLALSPVGEDAQQVARESLAGKYSIEYVVAKAQGQGFLSTIYGQTANALFNGCLAEMDKRPLNLFSLGSI